MALKYHVMEKEEEEYSIAPFRTKVHTIRSGMDRKFYLQITLWLPFRRERSPDGTTTTEAVDIQLQLATHLSVLKG